MYIKETSFPQVERLQMKAEHLQSALQKPKTLSVQVPANQAAECEVMLIKQISNLKCLRLSKDSFSVETD